MTFSNKHLVASITKAPTAELRVLLTTWHGSHKVELRDFTATIPNIFFPTSAGVSLDVEQLHLLIAALRKAESVAISRGMLSKGRAVA
ncbi:MAG: hypothetical protein ABSA62_15135 [Methyloceanibacter sp.]